MVASFFPGKIGSAAPGDGPPHFFPNRALLRVNRALAALGQCAVRMFVMRGRKFRNAWVATPVKVRQVLKV